MEIRECLCGCGVRFKVKVGNEWNWFVSMNHAELARHKDTKAGEAARRFFAAKKAVPKRKGYGLSARRRWYQRNYETEGE